MKILVIDDDMWVAGAVQRMLRDHDVVIETDPKRGLDRVMAETSLPFALVLTDFKMDSMTGTELIDALRKYDASLLLILMSGCDEITEPTVVADAVLAKPFSRAALREAITQVTLQRARAQTRRLRRVSAST